MGEVEPRVEMFGQVLNSKGYCVVLAGIESIVYTYHTWTLSTKKRVYLCMYKDIGISHAEPPWYKNKSFKLNEIRTEMYEILTEYWDDSTEISP